MPCAPATRITELEHASTLPAAASAGNAAHIAHVLRCSRCLCPPAEPPHACSQSCAPSTLSHPVHHSQAHRPTPGGLAHHPHASTLPRQVTGPRAATAGLRWQVLPSARPHHHHHSHLHWWVRFFRKGCGWKVHRSRRCALQGPWYHAMTVIVRVSEWGQLRGQLGASSDRENNYM